MHRSLPEDWNDVPNVGLVLVGDDDRSLIAEPH